MAKNKYTKIGVMLKGDKGPFLSLGNTKARKEEYNYNVKLQVKNGKGETVMVTNPLISLFDPRKAEWNKDKEINEKILYEVFVSEKKEDTENFS